MHTTNTILLTIFASDCTGCEACMKECPQQLDIASLMPEVAKTFETEVYGFTKDDN